MEYALGKWNFRLGAIHQIYRRTYEKESAIVESSPTETTIDYGNGTQTVDIADDDYLGQTTSQETKTSSTDFVYGLEFKANKHLNIELIQFIDITDTDFINSDFFRDLRLSLTVLF